MKGERRLTGFPLPAYRYIPGKGSKDEKRKDIPSVKTENFSSDEWRQSQAYLYGVDLFHHEYFYEAHEVWEALWHKVGHKSLQGTYLKALIQTAALQLKLLLGDKKTALRLGKRVSELMKKFETEGGGRYMGLRISNFLEELREQVENDGPTPSLKLQDGSVDE